MRQGQSLMLQRVLQKERFFMCEVIQVLPIYRIDWSFKSCCLQQAGAKQASVNCWCLAERESQSGRSSPGEAKRGSFTLSDSQSSGKLIP